MTNKREDDLLKQSAKQRLAKVRYDYQPPKKKKSRVRDYLNVVIIILVLSGLVISLLQLL